MHRHTSIKIHNRYTAFIFYQKTPAMRLWFIRATWVIDMQRSFVFFMQSGILFLSLHNKHFHLLAVFQLTDYNQCVWVLWVFKCLRPLISPSLAGNWVADSLGSPWASHFSPSFMPSHWLCGRNTLILKKVCCCHYVTQNSKKIHIFQACRWTFQTYSSAFLLNSSWVLVFFFRFLLVYSKEYKVTVITCE